MVPLNSTGKMTTPLFETVAARVDVLTNGIDNLRKDFELVIQDKSVPLEKRWELFVQAPSIGSHLPFLYVQHT